MNQFTRNITAYLILSLAFVLPSEAAARLYSELVQLFLAEGDSAGSYFGYQATGLGDVNGDCFDDILIGALGDRKAYIYFGGNPMDIIPDIVFYKENEEGFGYAVCNLGDFNGDSFTDFAIGSRNLFRVYFGAANLDTTAHLYIPGPAGREIFAAGDVNGDGYDDILISQENWESMRGKATLYLGGEDPDSIADWSTIGDSAYYYFGAGIAGNGDINGDGFDDMAILGWHSGNTYIKIYYGGSVIDTIPSLIIDESEHSLDINVRAAFININGDSFSDLCVDSGSDISAVLFYGPILPDIVPDLILKGTSLSGGYWEISEAGDVNNDGYPDIITGNYDGVGGFGEVLVFLGGPYMDGKWDILINGSMGPYKCAGRSVGKAGDVNGDGVDDILFGSWCEWDYNLQGRVVIFSGDTTLTLVLADAPLENEPCSASLKQNYPNPFNKSTVIEFDISYDVPTRTIIRIYNILGQEIITLVDEFLGAGHYQILWNGKDRFAQEVESGIYICKLQSGNFIRCNKMLLIK